MAADKALLLPAALQLVLSTASHALAAEGSCIRHRVPCLLQVHACITGDAACCQCMRRSRRPLVAEHCKSLCCCRLAQHIPECWINHDLVELVADHGRPLTIKFAEESGLAPKQWVGPPVDIAPVLQHLDQAVNWGSLRSSSSNTTRQQLPGIACFVMF